MYGFILVRQGIPVYHKTTGTLEVGFKLWKFPAEIRCYRLVAIAAASSNTTLRVTP
jgi:hypothetical protein